VIDEWLPTFYHKNTMKTHKISARLGQIMGMIAQHGTITVADLSKSLGVSEETIRRDARLLEERGDVLKLHGSLALPHQVGEAPFERRMRDNMDAKRRIAKAAVQLIEDGDSLIIDTGTTTSIFAQELRLKRGLTVVTNSSDIARTLATVNGNRVYMAGGELKADNGAAFGPPAVEFISRFRVRHSFISIAALHATDGPMDMAFEEAELARMALSRSDSRIILTDATKFGKTALVKVCDFSEVNRLICDAVPPPDLLAALQKANVTIAVANGAAS
jgi:DeoR family transcriptional regulator, glycerol-3-phosphate regulon repressor